ncbi:MAG: rsgA [Clostridiales bacterium]|nr:rsgA [Clostridiales bacterium]
MPSGIIFKGIGGFYYVEAQNLIYECKARGIFRKDEIIPLPGDRVAFSIIDAEKRLGNIDEIMPRDSQLIRPAVANINQVVMVIAAKSPSPDLMLLDKLLLTAEVKGLQSIICINKVDLDVDEDYKNIMEMYDKPGYTVIPISSVKKNRAN